MQSYETKTFGKLSPQPISLQTLNGKKIWGFSVNAALVKGLRRIPFTDESRVRFPYAVLLLDFQNLQITIRPSFPGTDFLFMLKITFYPPFFSILWTGCKPKDNKITLPDLRPNFQQQTTTRRKSIVTVVIP